MSIIMETFASRLKLVMEQKSLNQTDIGNMIGLSRQAVSKYFDEEKPMVPHPNNLMKLSAALDVDYAWLKDGKGKSPLLVDTKVDTFNEPPSFYMDMRSVLESYYKEVDLIKDLLTLKQDTYKNVIFGKPAK
jgi:transcriptional regulator with XRE-family HTH domain